MIEKNECDCELCRNNLPFDMPEEIIRATIGGQLVIFAGAGTSTETKSIFQNTLYEDVLTDLKKPPTEDLDFPSLMSRYCNSIINGRVKLLQKIKHRFDYCEQFSELYKEASRFHQELSSIYFIKSIFTTNWDDYFEKQSGAIPFVTAEDFAFYDLPVRKVYKIHGSISSYGTIVATKEDYDRCYKELNRGLLGSYLKTILATKVVVFVGYSFRDYDFIRIYDYLKKELKSVLPHCYIITIDDKRPVSIKNKNLTIIKTDGTYFLSAIRKHLEGTNHLFPKESIGIIHDLRYALDDIHIKTAGASRKHRVSNIVYCALYQDGLRHAFDYLIFHAKSGLSFYPPKIFTSVDSYSALRRTKLKKGNYADVAYVDGYIVGLKAIVLAKGVKDFPFWFLFGVGPISDKKVFDRAVKHKEVFHKKAELYGRQKFRKGLTGGDLVFHHSPFL